MRSDAGKEFTSKVFQEYLRSKDIAHFTTHSEKQANYVEQFIKTIKSRIWRHIRSQNSRHYIDVLQKLVDSYNKSWHAGILSEPINVNKQNESRLWWQMYWPKDLGIKKDVDVKRETNNSKQKDQTKDKKVKFLFKVGDKVRISHLRSAFQREYDIKRSGEIFKISKRFIRQGQPIYRIIDWFNNPVKGTFYQKELQKVNVSNADIFKIEKILKYKGRGKNKRAKICWLNWPKRFDSWIPVSELKK